MAYPPSVDMFPPGYGYNPRSSSSPMQQFGNLAQNFQRKFLSQMCGKWGESRQAYPGTGVKYMKYRFTALHEAYVNGTLSPDERTCYEGLLKDLMWVSGEDLELIDLMLFHEFEWMMSGYTGDPITPIREGTMTMKKMMMQSEIQQRMLRYVEVK